MCLSFPTTYGYLLFFSIQQKERLKWLGSIHFKTSKALIRNHKFREKESERKAYINSRKSSTQRVCLAACYVMYFHSFLPKISTGLQILQVKNIPSMHQTLRSRQFEESAHSSTQMLRFLAWILSFLFFLAFLFLSLVSWCSFRHLDCIVGSETMRNPGETSEQRVQGETSSEGLDFQCRSRIYSNNINLI